MDTMDEEDLLAYFSMQYKQNLLSLLRKLRLTEDSVSPFIRLQEKRKQAQLKQNTLEEKEEAFRERVKAINCQWRDFHTKDAQLKTYMNKSEKILKENDMPVQALAKVSKNRERRMQKETELLEVKRKLEALRNQHQNLSDEVQKYPVFNKCLEGVVKISRFEELQEVIWYYKTLMRMHKAPLQSQQEYKEMSEQANTLLDQYMAEKEAENLQYSDELMQLKLRFAQAQKDILLWETWWASVQDKIAKKSRKLRIVKMVSLNIFQSVRTQLQANLKAPVDDSHKQLNMIQQFIEDFTDLFLEVKQDTQNHHQAARSTEL